MWKPRVILIVISLVLVAILYSLPKVAVKNDTTGEVTENKESEPGDGSEGITGQDIVEEHKFEISSTDTEKILDFRKNFMDNTAADQLVYADSLASVYLKYNKYDSAAKYYEYVAINNPGNEQYAIAGDAYYEAFNFAMEKEKADKYGEKARYFYNLILENDPDRLDVKNNMAMTYISSQNPMQGITMLREIIEKDPENEMAIFNLGMLAVQSGQYDRAEERFKKLVSINAQNLQGQFYLGLSYYELGKKDDARKQFELVKSMENDPAVIATAESYLKELN